MDEIHLAKTGYLALAASMVSSEEYDPEDFPTWEDVPVEMQIALIRFAVAVAKMSRTLNQQCDKGEL